MNSAHVMDLALGQVCLSPSWQPSSRSALPALYGLMLRQASSACRILILLLHSLLTQYALRLGMLSMWGMLQLLCTCI